MPKIFSAEILAEAEKIHKPMLDQYFEDGMGCDYWAYLENEISRLRLIFRKIEFYESIDANKALVEEALGFPPLVASGPKVEVAGGDGQIQMKRGKFKLVEFIVDHKFYVGAVPHIYKTGERAKLRDHLADSLVERGIVKPPEQVLWDKYDVN